MALAAACTGSQAPPSDSPGAPKTSPPPVMAEDAYIFTDEAGIEARLRIEGDAARLTVSNDTGRLLPPPGIYVLDAADGVEVRWSVEGAAPIPDGVRTEFRVTRPDVAAAVPIGLVAMLFGGEDYGAFTPPRGQVEG